MPGKKGKNRKFKINPKALGIVAGVIVLAGTLPVVKRVVSPYETVTSVIDGDTFTIGNKQTIRLYGVDAPEISYCFGKEAKTALEKKILGKKVLIKSPRTDYWKRVQAYVYVNGEFVNEYMTLNGYGYDHTDGSEESIPVRDSGNFAKEHKVGIYSEECTPTKAPNKNCLIKGQISFANGAKTYRLPGCRDYEQTVIQRFRGEDYFCTEKEAQKAGFTKASTCK